MVRLFSSSSTVRNQSVSLFNLLLILRLRPKNRHKRSQSDHSETGELLLNYEMKRNLRVKNLGLQPHPCDANCNSSICYMHSWDHFDVHLVCTRGILSP